MKKIEGFSRGMGIGGWLTNYKRFNVLPDAWRMPITIGDMEHFESYITESDVKNIASMGLDHIRLGFDQVVVEEVDRPYVYRGEIFAIIRRFVEQCEKYRLNVVLNLHKAIGNYCDIAEKVTLFDSAELQDRFVALWVEFERRFADKPQVMFELLNEVRDIDPNAWNDLAERTIEAIRAINPARRIIVGGTCWNSPDTLDRLRVYDDENVIYTFHTYSPFEFTHQRGVLQAAPLYYNRAMPWPCDDIERYRDYHRLISGRDNVYAEFDRMDIDFIRHELRGAVAFVKAHPDKILWCGEFGTIRHCEVISRENWMRDVIAVLHENDIPYCVWNYLSTPNDGNRFSLVDDDRRQIVSERMLRVIRGEEA